MFSMLSKDLHEIRLLPGTRRMLSGPMAFSTTVR